MNQTITNQEYKITWITSFMRMWAISLRHLRQMRRDIGKFIHVFYWPFLDILLWGFTAQWVQHSYAHQAKFSLAFLTALIAWQLVARASLDVSTHLLEDIMDHNIVNIFATPLSIWEWTGGIFLLSFIYLFSLTIFCVMVIELLYHLNILSAGIMLAPFAFNLIITGFFIGFASAGFLIYLGRRALGFIYMMGYFFAPFSGAFYPIEILPEWLKIIAQALPFSYAIEGIRQLVQTGHFSWYLFGISFIMSAIYFVIFFAFFMWMFHCSVKKGLARLSD